MTRKSALTNRSATRLKVFMTQIGFHNWLVAAPSQKAALAAWDISENLFATGAATVITDKDCIALAMKAPGLPVAVDAKHAFARVTRVVHLAEHRKTPHRPPPAEPKKKPFKRKADRTKLDQAEKALEDFRKRAMRERAAILRAQKALDLKAEAVEEDIESKKERLEEALDEARDDFDAQVS
jgi:colicin import membrane protein